MHEELSELQRRLGIESDDSRKLASNPDNNPICSIAFDESIPAITVTWKRYATSTQLRFIHEYLLTLLQWHGASKILGDDTALATIHPDDREWISETWLPRAIACGLKAAVSKKPASMHGQFAVAAVQSELKGIAIDAFDGMADARQWLQSVSA
jgi:hypothetical protein